MHNKIFFTSRHLSAILVGNPAPFSFRRKNKTKPSKNHSIKGLNNNPPGDVGWNATEYMFSDENV